MSATQGAGGAGHAPQPLMTASKSSTLTKPLPPDGAMSAGQLGSDPAPGQNPPERENPIPVMAMPLASGWPAVPVRVNPEALDCPPPLSTVFQLRSNDGGGNNESSRATATAAKAMHRPSAAVEVIRVVRSF